MAGRRSLFASPGRGIRIGFGGLVPFFENAEMRIRFVAWIISTVAARSSSVFPHPFAAETSRARPSAESASGIPWTSERRCRPVMGSEPQIAAARSSW